MRRTSILAPLNRWFSPALAAVMVTCVILGALPSLNIGADKDRAIDAARGLWYAQAAFRSGNNRWFTEEDFDTDPDAPSLLSLLESGGWTDPRLIEAGDGWLLSLPRSDGASYLVAGGEELLVYEVEPGDSVCLRTPDLTTLELIHRETPTRVFGAGAGRD
jgi:hypothetical protein